jgi:transcriptional regulator with XRE-family HTH domain
MVTICRLYLSALLAFCRQVFYPAPVPSIEAFYEQLGATIRRHRLERGLTQGELAARLVPAVTRASIANLELGHQRVLSHTLVQLADALDVPVTDLLGTAHAKSGDWSTVTTALQAALHLSKPRAARLLRRLGAPA